MDKDDYRIIPSAKVELILTPQDGGNPLSIPLHPLASAFYHYGATTKVPPGTYLVEVHIEPPSFGTLDAPRFDRPERARFPWTVEEK